MNFNDDFEKYTKRIFVDKIPTAWARYADGERMIIENSIIGPGTQAYNIDHWSFQNNDIFRNDLSNTLNCMDDDYFYAISCKCCDYPGHVYYNKIIKNPNKSYANLWINSNFSKFRNAIENIKEDVIMIANFEGESKKYPFSVKKYFKIPDDVCNYYRDNKSKVIDELKKFCDFENTLVFVSAGPLSEILIYELWKLNKTNRYIDIGSALSDLIHGKITRPYMIKGSEYYGKVCE